MLPLVDIFSRSLQGGRLLLVWKQANVCPLYKKGDPADPANNRPVSITLYICKILESIIRHIFMTTYMSITYCEMNSLDLGLVAHVNCSC